jgi:hypothetical protein
MSFSFALAVKGSSTVSSVRLKIPLAFDVGNPGAEAVGMISALFTMAR